MRSNDPAQGEVLPRRPANPRVVSFRQVRDEYAVERLQGALRMLLPTTLGGEHAPNPALEIRRAIEVKR